MDANKVAAALAVGGDVNGEGVNEPTPNAEEIKKEHTESVWAGRAKKLAEEKAALQKELNELKSKRTLESALESIPQEVKGDTPDEITRPALAGAQRMVDEFAGKTEEELKKLRAEMADRDRKMFVSQIGAQNPKFFESVAPGGDKAKMWADFVSLNAETYKSINASNDVGRFNSFVAQFYSYIGSPNPSGNAGIASAPEPRSALGGIGQGGGDQNDKVYTTQEYLAEIERAEDAQRAGDMNTYRAITASLGKALKEGRVK